MFKLIRSLVPGANRPSGDSPASHFAIDAIRRHAIGRHGTINGLKASYSPKTSFFALVWALVCYARETLGDSREEGELFQECLFKLFDEPSKVQGVLSQIDDAVSDPAFFDVVDEIIERARAAHYEHATKVKVESHKSLGDEVTALIDRMDFIEEYL